MNRGAGFLGLVIGFLVGLSGMGGGAIMTPILVWTGWAPPAVAVGTNLVWTNDIAQASRFRGGKWQLDIGKFAARRISALSHN